MIPTPQKRLYELTKPLLVSLQAPLATPQDPSSNAIKVRKLIRFGLKKRARAPHNAVLACGLEL